MRNGWLGCAAWMALAALQPPTDKAGWKSTFLTGIQFFCAPPEVYLGELEKPGADEKHFDRPRGVACDPAGNLYVADWGNNRVQVFSATGAFLRSIPVQRPEQIAVHPKTGAIYVLRWEGGGATLEVHELVKLDKEEKPVAALPLKSVRYADAHHPGMFCLDASAEEPALWVQSGEGLRKVADRGGKLEVVLSLAEEAKAQWPAGWIHPTIFDHGYIAADPADLKPPTELAEGIGFRWAPYVAVTDETLYAHDLGNSRVVRCVLSYATEETTLGP